MNALSIIATALISLGLVVFNQAAEVKPHSAHASGVSIPEPLTIEHQELHEELLKVTQLRGATGAAGRRVAELLHKHFEKEEEYALPPLGLLRHLASGGAVTNHADVVKMTEKLKGDLPEMLAEHKAIVTALEELTAAAKKQKYKEAVRFAEKLKVHAQTEEQVLYPASILVGEYLKLKGIHR